MGARDHHISYATSDPTIWWLLNVDSSFGLVGCMAHPSECFFLFHFGIEFMCTRTHRITICLSHFPSLSFCLPSNRSTLCAAAVVQCSYCFLCTFIHSHTHTLTCGCCALYSKRQWCGECVYKRNEKLTKTVVLYSQSIFTRRSGYALFHIFFCFRLRCCVCTLCLLCLFFWFWFYEIRFIWKTKTHTRTFITRKKTNIKMC